MTCHLTTDHITPPHVIDNPPPYFISPPRQITTSWHRTGWSPCTHSTSEFFLWLVFFSLLKLRTFFSHVDFIWFLFIRCNFINLIFSEKKYNFSSDIIESMIWYHQHLAINKQSVCDVTYHSYSLAFPSFFEQSVGELGYSVGFSQHWQARKLAVLEKIQVQTPKFSPRTSSFNKQFFASTSPICCSLTWCFGYVCSFYAVASWKGSTSQIILPLALNGRYQR